jgi:hypothetical protein
VRRVLVAIILVLFVLSIGPAASGTPVLAHSEHEPLPVFVAGLDRADTALGAAIDLAVRSDQIVLVEDLADAQSVLLNDVVPSADQIAERVAAGGGVVLVMGPGVTSGQVSEFLGTPVTLEPAEDAVSLAEADESTHPLLDEVVWSSAPQVRRRTAVDVPQATPIIVAYETGEAILAEVRLGEGRIFLLSPYLDGENPQIQEWPYFNYLIYDLVVRAGGETPDSFGAYAGSPVPHARERAVLIGVCVGMMALSVVIFLWVRRYSLAHPEALDAIVGSVARFKMREVGTAWEEVGFHRPLAGFLFAMMMGILLFIPLIIYQNMVLPTFVLPSAQAFGLIGRVGQIFGLAWTLFDVGTSIAFIKFYSQYRVDNPRRAVQYGQVFVWWQALSGSLQVALVVILASTLAPRTAYAVYTWIIVVHALIQIPGFYRVMRDAMYAQQRLDYAQVLDNFLMLVWPMVTQPIFVLLMLRWSRSVPIVSPALGGAIGLAIAAYAVEVCNFTLGLLLYRRLGYNAKVLFMAHFDAGVIKEAFGFGVQDMSGSVILAAGSALEIFITQNRLVNYAEVWGNWMMANNFILAFDVLRNLVDGVMPAISEAISHARRKLSQYYVAMTYKWDALVGAFVASVLLAVADRFIIGSSGPEFARAAIYVLPLIAFGSVLHLNIIGDAVALASNRPSLKVGMIAVEQVLRIALALLLLERFQVAGLIIAYMVATLARGVAVYFVNSRVCFPLRYYPWQSLVAPLLAAVAHYAVLRPITTLIWQGDPITSIIIFLLGILFSYPLYMFFYGLFGGWDDATLGELERAVGMQPSLAFMARLFHSSTALGARWSPLHGRFPITIRDEAMAEARTLTQERVDLAKVGAAGAE